MFLRDQDRPNLADRFPEVITVPSMLSTLLLEQRRQERLDDMEKRRQERLEDLKKLNLLLSLPT